MIELTYKFDYKGDTYGNGIAFEDNVSLDNALAVLKMNMEETKAPLICQDEGHKWLPDLPEEELVGLPRVCERCKTIKGTEEAHA